MNQKSDNYNYDYWFYQSIFYILFSVFLVFSLMKRHEQISQLKQENSAILLENSELRQKIQLLEERNKQ